MRLTSPSAREARPNSCSHRSRCPLWDRAKYGASGNVFNFMKPDFAVLDVRVAQARVVLSLLALLSLYVDPSLGGLFTLQTWLITTLLCHLLYSALTFLAL